MTQTLPNQKLSPHQLHDAAEHGQEFQYIDVRSAQEFDEVHIPGAINIPLEQIEARLADLNPRQKPVLICYSGARAEMCRQTLQNHRDELLVLDGGTSAWERAGLPVVRGKRAGLPLMRQVQITAGLLILTGTLLGHFVNPSWVFLAMFVGAGLTFAGITGFCGLAQILAKMPWNQR